jgi:hypothetical protein
LYWRKNSPANNRLQRTSLCAAANAERSAQ